LCETLSSGSTLKLECGRYAKAGVNKPATGEDRILVVHLSQCRETSLSRGSDYMIYFVVPVCLSWAA
jgi:hypothetical protein